ncbi:MAG: hypothetical protein QGI65_09500, partial [SAR324 cluster bacterium]|nr:hypothetical protein [SAR324 cluster bacterium]
IKPNSQFQNFMTFFLHASGKIIISRNAVFFKTTGAGSRMCKYDTRKDFLKEGSSSIMIEVRRAMQSVFFFGLHGCSVHCATVSSVQHISRQ